MKTPEDRVFRALRSKARLIPPLNQTGIAPSPPFEQRFSDGP